ncbi:hypothetical protein F7734_55815 [Scytonema sp. UIC 10036]|uniref:hypothetical protein n=1 Tax=Scytonema sp. UIC 10036 TaxID=2304196 RepID=UPI0012DA90AD|nr:hypothetical protein [Scytonema sp. UIC 10036]MUH01048.1 hypothetical protein [Scytonema sp. UIC 10036]
MNPIKHLAKITNKISESKQIMQQTYLEFHLIEDFEGIHLSLLRELIELHSMILERVLELMLFTDVRNYNHLSCQNDNDTKEWFPWREASRFKEPQKIDNEQIKALYKKLKSSTGELNLSPSELGFIINAIEEKIEIE